MTIHVNIGEAKTRLSELLNLIRRGERVRIMRAGKPEAEIVPARTGDAVAVGGLGDLRRAAYERARLKHGDLDGSPDTIVPASMTPKELDQREARLRGPAD